MPARSRTGAGPAASGIVLGDDEPVVVDGVPRRLTGTLRVRTTAGAPSTLGPVVVRDPEGALSLPGDTAVRTTSRELDPDAETVVKLRLRLDDRTPPGEYRAEVDVAGTVRPLVVQVAERVLIDLSPRRVLVPNRPGGSSVTSIVVGNRGNVPVSIGDIGAVPLDDEQRDCRILRRTVDALTADGREVSVERLLTELTRASKEVLDETGVLRVRNLTGPADVAPGATARFDLEVEVPTTLDPHTRYTGFVPIATRTLTFAVVPGLPVSGRERPAPARRRRATPAAAANRRRPSNG